MEDDAVFKLFKESPGKAHLATDMDFWTRILTRRAGIEVMYADQLDKLAGEVKVRLDSYPRDDQDRNFNILTDVDVFVEKVRLYRQVLQLQAKEAVDDATLYLKSAQRLKRFQDLTELMDEYNTKKVDFERMMTTYKKEIKHLERRKKKYHHSSQKLDRLEVKLILESDRQRQYQLEQKRQTALEERQTNYRKYINVLNVEYEKWRELFKASDQFEAVWCRRETARAGFTMHELERHIQQTSVTSHHPRSGRPPDIRISKLIKDIVQRQTIRDRPSETADSLYML